MLLFGSSGVTSVGRLRWFGTEVSAVDADSLGIFASFPVVRTQTQTEDLILGGMIEFTELAATYLEFLAKLLGRD
jgi:hypothetical protein